MFFIQMAGSEPGDCKITYMVPRCAKVCQGAKLMKLVKLYKNYNKVFGVCERCHILQLVACMHLFHHRCGTKFRILPFWNGSLGSL